MKISKLSFIFCCIVSVAVVASSQEKDVLPDVPDGAQAVSLLGAPLFSSEPNEKVLSNLEKAREEFESDPDNADKIIWYGRRIAYTGDYREAILVFTGGIESFQTMHGSTGTGDIVTSLSASSIGQSGTSRKRQASSGARKTRSSRTVSPMPRTFHCLRFTAISGTTWA